MACEFPYSAASLVADCCTPFTLLKPLIVLSHWPHVRQQVCVARISSEQMTSLARKCVPTCCSTCVQCERFQQHSRTLVEQEVAQLVASVNGSVEIHGEYKFSNKLLNLLLNLLSNMWPV